MVKPLAPSARRTRGDTVLQRLRREILVGRVAPGGQLPPERELAQRLGTNRNTLREALRTLEAERLVRARQGDGTHVLDWRHEGDLSLLPHFLAEDTDASEQFNAMIMLLHLRDLLLCEAAERAARVASDDERRHMLSLVQRGRIAADGVESVQTDLDVYRAVVRSGHDLVLMWAYNSYERILVGLGARMPGLWTLSQAYLDDLEQVMHAIDAGHGPQAREMMNQLCRRRHNQILDAVLPVERDGEPPRSAAVSAPATAKAPAKPRSRPRRKRR